jgi:N-acetylmuramic acid 6-phosphate etherase
MVDVRPTNQKLKQRAIRLVSTIAEVDELTAEKLLEDCNWQVKVAVVMIKNNCSTQQAEQLLSQKKNKLKLALTSSIGVI